MSRPNNIKVSKNFMLYEYECKDGSHQVVTHQELIDKVQALRDRVKKPLTINSGYRNETHNKKVGGSKNSYHMKGMAVDIKTPNGVSRETMLLHARAVGFRGIIIYPTFIHVDIRPVPYFEDKTK